MNKKRKMAALFEVIAKPQGEPQVQVPSWFRRNRTAAVPVTRPSVRLKLPPGLAAQATAASAVAEVEEDVMEMPAPVIARPAPMAVPPAAHTMRKIQAAPVSTLEAPAPRQSAPHASAVATAEPTRIQTTVIPGAVAKTAAAAPAPAPAAPAPAAQAHPREQRPMAERIAGIVAGRLRLNLGYPACVAAAIALVVLLFGSYKLGQHSAIAAPAEAPVAASANPIPAAPATDGFDFDKALAVGTARYNAEKRFILVEQNVTNEADARAICEWLYKNGFVPLPMRDNNGQSIVVIAMLKEPATAAALTSQVDNIRNLGKSRSWKLSNRYAFAGAMAVEKPSTR